MATNPVKTIYDMDGVEVDIIAHQLASATKLAVNLANTSTDTTFDGSADVTNIKVSGTLPVSQGGTGATTAKGASFNINAGMNSGDDSSIVDATRFAFNYTSPSAETGGLYYRTAPKVWDWVKGKLSSDTSVTISGTTVATKLTSSNNLNDYKGGGVGTIREYYWESSSVPSNTPFSDSHASMMVVYGTSGVNYAIQKVYRGSKGIYQRKLVNNVWDNWEKMLVDSDVPELTSTDAASIWNSI